MPSIAGGIHGTETGTGFNTIRYYKYIPYDTTNVLTKQVKDTVTKKSLTRDEIFNVTLGGPFEVIGGKDEVVGGGSQKVG